MEKISRNLSNAISYNYFNAVSVLSCIIEYIIVITQIIHRSSIEVNFFKCGAISERIPGGHGGFVREGLRHDEELLRHRFCRPQDRGG